MRYTAFALWAVAFLLSLAVVQRTWQAANQREAQPADDNDVLIVTAMGVLIIALCLGAVIAAVLA